MWLVFFHKLLVQWSFNLLLSSSISYSLLRLGNYIFPKGDYNRLKPNTQKTSIPKCRTNTVLWQTHTHTQDISHINSMNTKQVLFQNSFNTFVLGLENKVLVVRGLQKWPLWEEAAPMLDRARSKKDLLLVKVEPTRNNGSACVKTYLRKSKKLLQSNCDRRSIKIREKQPCKHEGQRRKGKRCSRWQSRHAPVAHGEGHRDTGKQAGCLQHMEISAGACGCSHVVESG